jgi:predicted DCC family thiol-disulfide oxidoreductase YuxK
MSDGAPPVMVFDGVCVFCSRSVAFILRHEREPLIRFVAIQSDEGRSLARKYGVDPDDPDSFLFIENGVAHPKSGGLIALARHLKAPGNALTMLAVLPRTLRDWLYDRVARNRYRLFGKRVSCMMPTAETRRRFALPD